MKVLTTYLNFAGETREAMTFYAECLGGELVAQTFADMKMEAPPGSADRVIHARINKGGAAVLMASDNMPGMSLIKGNNFHVMIDCESVDETNTLFAALGAGGTVSMELQDTFWGAYFGMLTDKFGVQWMFNCERPKEG